VERELSARVLRACPGQAAAAGENGDRVAAVMAHMIERLSDHPAVVFSRSGEVLAQTRAAIALLGESSRLLVEVGTTRWHRLSRYRHAELGVLELYRQLLVDPVEHQMLLVFTAVPGSPSEEKLRRLAATGD
jgi:hypothetical protein